MSTRKSLRHHLLLRHVLRNRESYNLLLGKKLIKKNESNLVEFILQSPELMWQKPINKLNSKIEFFNYPNYLSNSLLKEISLQPSRVATSSKKLINIDDCFFNKNDKTFVFF